MAAKGTLYKELRCSDFRSDCNFITRARNESELLQRGHEHACRVHNRCDYSPQSKLAMTSRIRNVWI